jgi:hypothetical protein
MQPVTKIEEPLLPPVGSAPASSVVGTTNHTVLKTLIQDILQEMFAKQFVNQGQSSGPLNTMPDATLVAKAVLTLLQRNGKPW